MRIYRLVLATMTVLSLILMTAAGAAGQTATQAATIQGPKLHIPDSTFEFGTTPQRSTISHVFWLHNIGTDTLRIIKVVPG